MKDYLKMTSPENDRRKLKEHVYGNKNGYVDYHHIEDFEVNGEKLKDLFINLQTQIDNLQKQNERLIGVIKKLNKRNQELESKVKEYGII